MLQAQENTTQSGASIHDRLMAHLEPEDTNDSQIENAQDSDEDTRNEQVDDGEDLEVEAEESEESDEESDESEEESADGETETEYDLSDIAQLVGLEQDKLSVSDDGKILVKTKIDGQVGETSLDELVRAYQKAGHLDNQTQQTAELKKSLQAQMAEQQQQIETKLNELDSWSQIAWSQLQNEINAIDWNELRAEDPAEWAAKQQEFQARENQIRNMYANIQAEKGKIDTQQQEQLKHILAEENAKLVKAIPGWEDEKVASKEYRDVLGYGESIGYAPDALGSIRNHLDVKVLWKAMQYDKMQEKKVEVKKAVKKAPKIVKPGQAATQQDRKAVENKQLRANIKAGKTGSAAQWLLANGKV